MGSYFIFFLWLPSSDASQVSVGLIFGFTKLRNSCKDKNCIFIFFEVIEKSAPAQFYVVVLNFFSFNDDRLCLAAVAAFRLLNLESVERREVKLLQSRCQISSINPENCSTPSLFL